MLLPFSFWLVRPSLGLLIFVGHFYLLP